MFGWFKKKKTLLDQVQEASIAMFRPLLSIRKETTDQELLSMLQEVMSSFTQAATFKGDHIDGTTLMNITSHFIQVYDLKGKNFYDEHLKYELDVYKSNGLRESFVKQGGNSRTFVSLK
jgi:hypothetical protein